jgi:hypothetical protein
LKRLQQRGINAMLAVSKHPPLMLERLSTFVLEVLPWAFSSLIGVYLVWTFVVSAQADLQPLAEQRGPLTPQAGVSQTIEAGQADCDGRGVAALRTTVCLAGPIHEPK